MWEVERVIPLLAIPYRNDKNKIKMKHMNKDEDTHTVIRKNILSKKNEETTIEK